MENLDKALKSKKLEDLVIEPKTKVSNLLEPTQAEIEQIISLILEGKPYKEIRKSIRRVVMDREIQVSAKGFSYGQIKEIELGVENKITELTPCTVCGKIPCTCPKPVVKPNLEEEINI